MTKIAKTNDVTKQKVQKPKQNKTKTIFISGACFLFSTPPAKLVCLCSHALVQPSGHMACRGVLEYQKLDSPSLHDDPCSTFPMTAVCGLWVPSVCTCPVSWGTWQGGVPEVHQFLGKICFHLNVNAHVSLAQWSRWGNWGRPWSASHA